MHIRIAAIAMLGALITWGAPEEGNPPPQFDVASVRLDDTGTGGAGDRFPQHGTWKWTRIPLNFLVSQAYGVSLEQVTNIPQQFQKRETAFTIIAKTRPDVRDAEFRLMLQSLLKERFQFAMHRDMKELPAITIEIAKGGSLLKPASGECAPVDKSATPPQGQVRCGEFTLKYEITEGIVRQRYSGRSVSISDIAEGLSSNGPAVDDTGTPGKWDIDVAIEEPRQPPPEDRDEWAVRELAYQKRMRTAFEKQAGLAIDFTKAKKRPVPVIVIDHVELPTPN